MGSGHMVGFYLNEYVYREYIETFPRSDREFVIAEISYSYPDFHILIFIFSYMFSRLWFQVGDSGRTKW